MLIQVAIGVGLAFVALATIGLRIELDEGRRLTRNPHEIEH